MLCTTRGRCGKGGAMRIAYVYFMIGKPRCIGTAVPAHVAYWNDQALPGYLGGPFRRPVRRADHLRGARPGPCRTAGVCGSVRAAGLARQPVGQRVDAGVTPPSIGAIPTTDGLVGQASRRMDCHHSQAVKRAAVHRPACQGRARTRPLRNARTGRPAACQVTSVPCRAPGRGLSVKAEAAVVVPRPPLRRR